MMTWTKIKLLAAIVLAILLLATTSTIALLQLPANEDGKGTSSTQPASVPARANDEAIQLELQKVLRNMSEARSLIRSFEVKYELNDEFQGDYYHLCDECMHICVIFYQFLCCQK